MGDLVLISPATPGRRQPAVNDATRVVICNRLGDVVHGQHSWRIRQLRLAQGVDVGSGVGVGGMGVGDGGEVWL